ncbi:MAG: DNA repair protein RecN [Prevotella sp.]|jgi:DNA repair protein RecN (Recombination protein N)
MLKQLYIKNFTLIDELNITLYPGFSVITGETGAGKSIILGAIQLLLGQRADTKQIKNGQKKCVIEARFDLSKYDMKEFFEQNDIDYDPGECIIRREMNSNGKSRAFINDTPASLNVMRELGEQLIDIHSQHQSLLLQKADFQLNVLDIMADNGKLLDAYRKAYQTYQDAQSEYVTFEKSYYENQENEEFLRFQSTELENANLVEGEQEDLEHQQKLLSHAEDVKNGLYTAMTCLSGEQTGAIDQVRQAIDQFEDILEVYPDLEEMTERLRSAYIEMKDINQEVESRAENVNFDPQQLQVLSDRLDMLYSLERKFHVDSVEDLIAKRDSIKEELQGIENGSEHLQELKEKEKKAYKECMEKAVELSNTRKKAAAKVESEMKIRLVPLGIPNVKFAIEFKKKECTPTGIDNASFLFNANNNDQLQPISQVASGGEIARIMLSLKAMISGAVKLPTIIFDEIDTGVSGRIAEKMAHIMREMGNNNRQVISITHLPQIAALGNVHYKVSKADTPQGTVSHMQKLTDEERVKELAQMLSGSDISAAAIENARTLLQNGVKGTR